MHRPYQPGPTASEWYTKGEDALHSMTFEAARKALEQSVAADPKFALAFSWFMDALPGLSPAHARLLGPYVGRAHPLRFTLGPDPWELLGRIAGNAAVAFGEEFFYRGYVTLRLEERWPPVRRILGAPMGKAALLAAVLFALGHLLEPAPWRLFVFFPALIFAWLRARTGTIVGAAICHFIFNVTLLLLERAAFA